MNEVSLIISATKLTRPRRAGNWTRLYLPSLRISFILGLNSHLVLRSHSKYSSRYLIGAFLVRALVAIGAAIAPPVDEALSCSGAGTSGARSSVGLGRAPGTDAIRPEAAGGMDLNAWERK